MREFPDQTYRQFYERLRQKLPSSRYPQCPQLEGKDINKNLQLFSPKNSTKVEILSNKVTEVKKSQDQKAQSQK